MKRAAVVGLSAAAVCVAGLLLLSGLKRPALAGSNQVPAVTNAVALPAGQQTCLPDQVVPANASTAQLVVTGAGRSDGRVVLTGTTGAEPLRGSAPRHDGTVGIPLSPIVARSRTTTVCIRNAGPGPIVLAGRDAAVAIAYTASDEPTWLSQAGTLADRFDHVRWAPAGDATLWLALVLALAAVGGGVALTVGTRRGG